MGINCVLGDLSETAGDSVKVGKTGAFRVPG